MSKEQSKLCPKCQQQKLASEFHRSSVRDDGLQLWCKGCTKAAQREWMARNPDKIAAQRAKNNIHLKNRYATDEVHRNRVKARVRAWKNALPAEVRSAMERNSRLQREYGISQADFDRIAAQQQGRCACCNRKPKQLIVDHDHSTGEFRGLVCYACNVGIGLLGDTPEAMVRANKYLTSALRQHEPLTFVA